MRFGGKIVDVVEFLLIDELLIHSAVKLTLNFSTGPLRVNKKANKLLIGTAIESFRPPACSEAERYIPYSISQRSLRPLDCLSCRSRHLASERFSNVSMATRIHGCSAFVL